MQSFSKEHFSQVLAQSTRLILGLVVAWVLVVLVAYEINLIRAPFQLEYREGSILLTTQELLQGRNPWAPESQPAQMNSYGIGYHLVVLPLAQLFGNSFFIHRLVSGLGLLLAAALVAFTLIRRGGSPVMAVTAGALIFANQLFYVTPLSRPDGLGLLLFVAAAFLPWADRYSRRSLAFSALLAVLGFFTKAYFILGGVYVAAYLLVTWRKEFWGYCLLVSALLGVGALVTARVFPYYFYDTFYNHMILASRSLKFISYQSMLYGSLYAVPFLLLIVLLGQVVWRWKWERVSFVRSILQRMDFPTFGLIGSLLVIGLSMGWHMGTLMTYYFQLITPFLVATLVLQLRGHTRLESLANLGLIVTLFFNLTILGINLIDGQTTPATLASIPNLGQNDWSLIRERIGSSQKILNSPVMVGELMAQGRSVVYNGQSDFYFFSMDDVPNFFLLPAAEDVARRGREFRQQILENVQNRSYDWIVLTKVENDVSKETEAVNDVHQFYRKVDQVVIDMPQGRQIWTLEFWAPLPR